SGARACDPATSVVSIGPVVTYPVPSDVASPTAAIALGYACAGGMPVIDPTGRTSPRCDGGDGVAFFRTVRFRTPPPNHNPEIAGTVRLWVLVRDGRGGFGAVRRTITVGH